MILTDEQLKKIHQIEVELLKAFIDVCNRLNLQYYISDGTLLGAVRHKGFIPWDDDIDIVMKRDDYEVFIREGQNLLPEKYFISTLYSNDNVPFNFCKIHDNDTTFIEKSCKGMNINHGVKIDIFPLDYYPDDEKERCALNRKHRILRKIARKKYKWFNCSVATKLKELFYKVVFCFYPYKKAVKQRENLYRSVKQSKMFANYSGCYGERDIVPVEWFHETIQLEFEGLKVNAPAQYDKWLTQVYGDYMQLPPEEKRVGHHYTEVIDLERSYLHYIKRKGDKK